uniref:Uncharacterized protein n=1 Tax=Candidatus Kentrum sp. LPFa TaxID=2126335 RepID=A0A450XPU2_9GAMM|nr:MAG: hypothetical protein BECKLPF1236A_GA0070988_101365 [Candidatus Kentron sp. LPFa]VFK31332.1 MAG: hypothetical protein BECKLPF1236C_GA0070990_101355 [Candidatus Kentron sp. LPFa]
MIEDNLVFYVPQWRMPRFFSRCQTLYFSIRLNWPGVVADFRSQMNWPHLIIRQATIHRNAWGCVLRSDVYIESQSGVVNQEIVRSACRRIIKKSFKQAKSSTSLLNLLRYLPLGFAEVHLFRKDYRHRRLANFGLAEDLIATVRLQRIHRIESPYILGSTIENHGRYRIAWNKAWLEETTANDEMRPVPPDAWGQTK